MRKILILNQKMEDRLAEYRRQRRKTLEKTSANFTKPQKSNKPFFLNVYLQRSLNSISENSCFKYAFNKLSSLPILGNPLVLKFLLWLILFGLFCEIEFGIVYVVLSLFFIIYYNTSTKKRSKSKLSAYSVFNENFEKLDGTFTAEQFEKELTHRI